MKQAPNFLSPFDFSPFLLFYFFLSSKTFSRFHFFQTRPGEKESFYLGPQDFLVREVIKQNSKATSTTSSSSTSTLFRRLDPTSSSVWRCSLGFLESENRFRKSRESNGGRDKTRRLELRVVTTNQLLLSKSC